MKNRILSANQRVLIGVLDQAFCGEKVALFARTLKRVGLTLEIEERSKEILVYAARRIATNDISAPVSEMKPVAKAGAA